MLRLRTIGLLFAAFLPAFGADSKPLTLDQAIALAEQYNPRIHSATAGLRAAEAGIVTAKAYPNPDVLVMEGHQYTRPILTPAVPGMLQHYSVSQPIELPSVRRTRRAAAQEFQASTSFGVAGVRLGVRADVKRVFYDVLRRQEEIAHAQENLALVQDLRRRTQVQVDVGEIGRLELTRAEAEVTRAESLVRSARLMYLSALSGLRAVMGVPLEQNVEPQGDLDSSVTLPDLAQLRTAVLRTHPGMQQARSEVERARTNLKYENALRLPQPTVYGEFENQPDLRFYRFGIGLPIPLWNQRKGPIAEAAAALTSANAEETQRGLQLVATLERAYGQYRVANEQVEALQGGALKEAEAAVQTAQAAYKFGERGIMEVLDAQRVLHTVRGDLLDAQYAREAALIDLEEVGAIKLNGGN